MAAKRSQTDPFRRADVVGLLLRDGPSEGLSWGLLSALHAWCGSTAPEADDRTRVAHWQRHRDPVGLLLSFECLRARIERERPELVAGGVPPGQTRWALDTVRAWVIRDIEELRSAMHEGGAWPPRLGCGHPMPLFLDLVRGCPDCRRAALASDATA